MADNKEKIKEEQLKDVNGGVIIVTSGKPTWSDVGCGGGLAGTSGSNTGSDNGDNQ